MVSRSPRIIAAAVAAVAAAAVGTLVVAGPLVGGSGDDDPPTDEAPTVQPGAPGEAARELTDDEVAALGTVEHAPADTAFMQAMIVHHGQALAMAQLVDSRTIRSDVPLLAERIRVSQEAEIEQMEQWLTDRDEPLPDATDDEHSDHMAGMATAEQLEELKLSTGPAFDRLFLDRMIAHHQGAVTMVDAYYTAGGGLEPAADQIALAIEADQTIEILRMQELAASLG